jgi:hypothetical protein
LNGIAAAFVKTEAARGGGGAAARLSNGCLSRPATRSYMVMQGTGPSRFPSRIAFAPRQVQMTDEPEQIARQSQDLIGALRRERDDLLDQIRKSQETIASSQQLIKRLDEVLAKAENPEP